MQSTRHSCFLPSLLLALLGSASCTAEPDVRDVRVQREKAAPAANVDVQRRVLPGPLATAGDARGSAGAASFPACSIDDSNLIYPGKHWDASYAQVQGWSEEGLERAWRRARQGNYASGMLVHRGKVIGRFGDVAQPYEAASIRKSLLNAVIGQLVAENRLDIGTTLGELGLRETPPLNSVERSVTVRDLLMSRSGIYRPAAYTLPSQDEERPEPGQYRPGEHFYYNNWDFNALGTIAEKAGGANVFQLLETRVAAPVGMEDYTLDDTRYERDDRSLHPAYLIRMSTRDRARFGLLYLRNGCWNGRQIVPAGWVKTSTSPLTDREGEQDYGYLWWSQEPIEGEGLNQRIYMARGNPLQYVMVLPDLDAVLVLTADRNYPGWINWVRSRLGFTPEFEDFQETLSLVLAARPTVGGEAEDPAAAKPEPD